MKINIDTKLSGRVEWELLTQSGLVLKSGKQSNLVLTSGLNSFANETSSTYSAFRSFLAIGTGSTAPNTAQTALIAEHGSRSNSNGGFSVEETTSMSSDATHFIWESRIVRVITLAAAVNLTEFGFAPAGSGNISIRELFRDGLNNPITIAGQIGNIIKVTHILRVKVPIVPLAGSFTITGTNGATFNATMTWFNSGVFASQAGMMENFAPNNSNFSITTCNNTTPTGSGTDTINGAGTAYNANTVILAYTANSFARTKQFTWTPSQGNGAIGGWVMRNGTSFQGGFKIIINGSTYTKQATDSLRFSLQTSWSA